MVATPASRKTKKLCVRSSSAPITSDGIRASRATSNVGVTGPRVFETPAPSSTPNPAAKAGALISARTAKRR
ncbi:MAG: hypothetical protein DI536_08685 [Archangium gephyra]|uniref:Uncharacterized protein n=1 Tax=Archangium gephyra TaxID=48 RepID=A0A2W5TVX4_9BACT|nr:MAG: hypothetical protein DI536_08685 [Archangium gephyra]